VLQQQPQQQQQSINFASIPATTLVTGTVSLSATASSALPVTFASTTPSICTVSGSTVTLLATGTCTVAATQAGNAQYSSASTSQSFAVTLASQTIAFPSIADTTYGQAAFTLNATASSGLPVSFASATPAVCWVSEISVTLIAGGTCIIQANQPGNVDYAAAPSVSQSFNIRRAIQTVTFAPVPATTLLTGTVTLSASASSGLPVSFASTTPLVCAVSGSTATLLAVGICTVNASQAGNLQYSSSSSTHGFSVTLAPQKITFPALPAVAYGTAPFDAIATASSGLPVNFASMAPWVCSVSANSVTIAASGKCTLMASQSGNYAYAAAAPVTSTFTVTSPTNKVLAVANTSPRFIIAGSAALNVTLQGTNFLPGITAICGGAARNVTYVNSSTLNVSLTADDLAKAGTLSIVLNNPAPDYGAAAITLPLLYETPAMLARSQLAAGDQGRLQRLIEKGREGKPVTIATIGGSITAGVGASDSAHGFAPLLNGWWSETFPASASKLVNAGISGTASDYGSLRVERDVLSYNPDLVVVEFAVNDINSAFSDTYEGLLRQLLNAPSQPAVILLFMMRYSSVPGEDISAEPWQSLIGAHYNLPMVSFYDAISPELAAGNLTVAQIGPDGVHPSDLGHAYVAHFLEQNLQAAIDNFPGEPFEDIPGTESPMYSNDYEFTSLQEGNGNWGASLNPDSNQGWIAVRTAPGGSANFPSEGLETSTPGSTLDFTVTGKHILIGYWQSNGPMGQVRITVDGAISKPLSGFYTTAQGFHVISRVASGLQNGPHRVHIELLDTSDSGSTGTTFDLLCVGTGGRL
jgi:lysophospholipase L1-like esterase